MNYFALQVRTNGEDKFIHLAKTIYPDMQFYFPKRTVNLRSKGKNIPIQQPIFSGYVFADGEADRLTFRGIEGFYRALGTLSKDDQKLVNHFVKTGSGKSKVYFEDSRIVVVSGAMLGLEGRIVKVDRRKCRAKVRLDLFEDQILVDLSYDVIEKIC